MFDVAEAVVFVAFADGEDAVKEVVEFLASGQVVLGDWVGKVSLGGVGDDEDGEVVFLLELHEFHHEDTCCFAFVGGVAEVCKVVNDDDVGVGYEGGIFDVFDDGVFVVVHADCFGVDFCSDESVRKDVSDVVFYVVVS